MWAESSFIHSIYAKLALSMWHLACAGLPIENQVDKVPVPVHTGQQSEIINNKITEGATKEINRAI